ncbi:hypothetical protein [Microbispora amethystogenes]|uniref:hypothetical protein n=1 Tax=Microbispora amethystogenes TaxID=1427754 RepID=UPI001952CCD7|nr:hypothetical protein [Microbispora amethystogenes]
MSRTSRSIRGRCAALAAVTAGVSWLTWGTAMAKDGASSDACRPQNRGVTDRGVTDDGVAGRDVARHEIARREATDRDVRGVPATLAPAAGVLSIADAAGSAAGQGHRSLPGRPGPDPAVPGAVAKPVLPALTAPRALPGTSSARTLTGLVPRAGNAPVHAPGAVGGGVAGVPGAAGLPGAPGAVGGATTPAAAGARSLPAGLAAAPSSAKPISAGASVLPSPTKPISLGTSALPSATKPLSAGTSALSSPARSLTAPAAALAGSRMPAAAPVANSGALLPARSAVPLLAVAPARPSAPDAACPRQAPRGLRGEPAAQEGVRPITEGRPRAHRHPRPEEEAGNAAQGAESRGHSPQGRAEQNRAGQDRAGQDRAGQDRAGQDRAGQKRGAHNPGAQGLAGQNAGGQNHAAHDPAGQNPAGPGSAARPAGQTGLTPRTSSVSTSSQSGASGQEQSTETFPREHRHRKHHPHKQNGAGTPEQAANQAGRPSIATQEDTGTLTERKNGAGHRRQRDDAAQAHAGRPQAAGQGRAGQGKAAQGRNVAPAVQPETVGGRRIPRLQPREYPRAAAHQQGGDITTPAALTRATGTHGVTDFAAATGNKILP